MKRNKGFTLTELLAVIIILGLIIAIVIPAINKTMLNNKVQKCTFYVESVEKALKAYADMELPSSITNSKVSLQYLISKEYLAEFSGNSDGIVLETSLAEEFTINKDSGKVDFDEVSLNFKINENSKSCTSKDCS